MISKTFDGDLISIGCGDSPGFDHISVMFDEGDEGHVDSELEFKLASDFVRKIQMGARVKVVIVITNPSDQNKDE